MPLDPPPHDDNGEVVPHDHKGIGRDDGVIRLVSKYHLVDDPKVGGKRLSTKAFQPSSGENGGMSVDLQALIEEDGLDPRKFAAREPWVGAVRFTAGRIRSLGLIVGYDPLIDNPYHGEVWGNFTKGIQNRLKDLAEPFLPIP